MISPAIKTRITQALDAVEREHGVRILYACESGSRAWGFASADSDYDVRFLYIHPLTWYLSIVKEKRDVLEKPIKDNLDLRGWELRKALRLFRKSHPSLMEWLQSPIVYREPYSTARHLRALMRTYYSVRASIYHYLHMAERNYCRHLQGEEVSLKKYLYVLRPLLAVLWIEQGRGVVPVDFHVLLREVDILPEIRREIEALVARKKAGEEQRRGSKIPLLHAFISKN